MKLLDRYVLRNFLEPFLICFGGFIAIWLVFDLSNNGQDFIEAHASLKAITLFYLTQLPQTILVSLPVGLLLALLASLTRMSRFNEIISMLTAGRSIVRVIFPLLIVGAVLSLGMTWLEYEPAPRADAVKKSALEQISRGKKGSEIPPVDGYLFRDRQNNRTWYVRKFKPNALQFDGVHITQQDTSGNITRKWYARRAVYDPRAKTWTLVAGAIVDFDVKGDISWTDYFPTSFRLIADWDETPWRIASSNLDAQNLTVPQLREYLVYNLDFPAAQLAPYRTYLAHRWAQPWSCLVVVLIAAPLGIVYSRRGQLAGVASALLIFFVMIFMTNLFLALGKGARVSAFTAAWTPNIVGAVIGLVLLYFRSTNRDLPSLSFSRLKK